MAEKQSGLSSDIDGSDKLDDSKHNESSTAVADAEELVKAEEMAQQILSDLGLSMQIINNFIEGRLIDSNPTDQIVQSIIKNLLKEMRKSS